MINRKSTFDNIRKSFGKLTVTQVEGFTAIFDEWESSEYDDLRWLAYMLATAWHETAKTMQPIEEYGKGRKRKYGQKVKMSGVGYTTPDKIYFGRGFVQLTWYENYQLMGRLIGVDLLNHPELALVMRNAIKIMFEGMTKGASSFGDFTGKCLEIYFNKTTDNPVGARKIINGIDKAGTIAGYHNLFLTSIIIARNELS
ncbi:MAG: hypothetical protein K2X95_00355 [Flavobacteriaceae bacterium]|nr:hypothetical protein [Flavobacteriaceae bacterium]